MANTPPPVRLGAAQKYELDAVEAECDHRHRESKTRFVHLEKRDAILWGDKDTKQGGRVEAIEKKQDEQGDDIKYIKKAVSYINIKLAGLTVTVAFVMQLAWKYLPSP